MYPQFTRTLDAHVPAIYPHPRLFYPPFTRTLIFLPAIYPHPRFFYPQFTRTRGTRRPSLPSHPRNPSPVHTRDPRAPCPRWCPVPVAPAARRYPATRETLRPCIPATRAPRVPVTLPAPVRCPSPWRPRPASSPSPCVFVPAVPIARRYPTARTRACSHPHRGAYGGVLRRGAATDLMGQVGGALAISGELHEVFWRGCNYGVITRNVITGVITRTKTSSHRHLPCPTTAIGRSRWDEHRACPAARRDGE